MSNYSKITITVKGDMGTYTLDNPHGFGVNEFQFFCSENDTKLLLIPVDQIESVYLEKSKILKV